MSGLLALGLVALELMLASQSSEKVHTTAPAVVLEVGLPHNIEVSGGWRFFEVTLHLVNRGEEPVYVGPVIGDMGGRLRVFVRRAGDNGLPGLLYDRHVMSPAFQIEDLFKLMPGHSLERRMEFQYPKYPSLPEQGLIEIWAEYDSREMSKADERAFGAVLRSEPVSVPVKRIPGAAKRK